MRRRKVGDLVVAATLLAGIIAVERQRREADARARGSGGASRAGPDAARYGRVASGLAQWVPAPPRTRCTRALASAWSAPLTAVGAAMAVTTGALPRWDPALRCFVARGVRGPSAFALRLVGAEANAIGQVVLARVDAPSPALLAHEAVHVRQAERLGPLLLPVYVWLGARYGYRGHPLEIAARTGARRAIGRPGA